MRLVSLSEPKRIELTFAYRVVARLVSATLQASIFLLLARNLSLREMGVIVLGQATGTVVGAVISFGIPSYALRLRAKNGIDGYNKDRNAVEKEVASLAVIYSAVGTIIIFSLLWISGVRDLTLLAAASVAVAIELIGNTLQAMIAGSGRQHFASNTMILQRVLVLLPLGITWLVGAGLVLGYLIINGILFAALVITIIRIWGLTLAFGRALRASFGYWGTSIGSSLANLDVAIVRLTVGGAGVGLYGIATRLISPLSIVATSIVTILVPTAVVATEDGSRKIFRRSYRVIVIFAVCVCLLAVPSANLAAFLLGDAYAGSRPVIAAVIVGVSLSGISQVIVAEMFVLGKPWRSAIGIGVGTLLGLLLFLATLAGVGIAMLWTGPILLQSLVLLCLLLARSGLRRAKTLSGTIKSCGNHADASLDVHEGWMK